MEIIKIQSQLFIDQSPTIQLIEHNSSANLNSTHFSLSPEPERISCPGPRWRCAGGTGWLTNINDTCHIRHGHSQAINILASTTKNSDWVTARRSGEGDFYNIFNLDAILIKISVSAGTFLYDHFKNPLNSEISRHHRHTRGGICNNINRPRMQEIAKLGGGLVAVKARILFHE